MIGVGVGQWCAFFEAVESTGDGFFGVDMVTIWGGNGQGYRACLTCSGGHLLGNYIPEERIVVGNQWWFES